MNTKQQKGVNSPPPAIGMRDIYYVLFRHKWMIGILITLGVICAAGVYIFFPFPYVSHAKVIINYIQDAKPPTDLESGSTKVVSPDVRGGNIMNTELEILTSMDLAAVAASNLGPARILGKGENNSTAAASVIAAGLKAEVPKESDVIILQFESTDPTLPQAALGGILTAYNSKYKEIHLEPGVTETNLEEQTLKADSALKTKRKALSEAKAELGITSLEDAKKNAQEIYARIRESKLQTEADLEQSEAIIKDRLARIGSATSNASAAHPTTNLAATLSSPSADVMRTYKHLTDLVNTKQEVENRWLTQVYPDSNPTIREATAQRKQAEDNLKAFEDQNPGVLAVRQDLSRPGSPGVVADPMAALEDARSKQNELLARSFTLSNQLVAAVADAAKLDAGEDNITTAESEVKAAEAKYTSLRNATDSLRINAEVGNNVFGTKVAEQPTPPSRDFKKVLKATASVFGAFVFLAFGLPFLIEMVLDQSIKNPMDLQARIGIPFFINIPRINGNGNGKMPKLKPASQVPLLANGNGNGVLANGNGDSAPSNGKEQSLALAKNGDVIAASDERHELRPFFETLRDRLMTYFEMVNLTHKPKLVAVTSCGAGAGVTTTAAGLASSLSEIGEGNVLLVSMNVRDGEAHHFYKGKLTCGIEEVLEKENREQAQVQNNLFVAREAHGDDRLPRVLPKRFSHLVPMLKASDYDYIIFDMPPVSEISITPRLARFMDMVLLVVESEKTSRDAATRVASLLAESKTHVGMVLNKNRSYMPKRLEQAL